MSIPAQGRRGVLFPPPGVKIRRTIETLYLPATATLIAGRDPNRVLLSVSQDYDRNMEVAFAGSPAGLNTVVSISGTYHPPLLFWGPEEVWALCTTPFSPPGGNILVQSVFYD